ncbi:ABC transporter ATP-binding protein [Phytoactinopolyspora alkaliphila]|nr:ABC transporter ATP-binding protein [Phytoactinopolyspora alkaliphila]
MDSGIPDHRGALRYLWWLVVRQRGRVAVGALVGSAWTVGLTLPPYVLSRVIDDGLTPGNTSALVGWAAVLLGVGVLNAWLAITRHRTMSKVRMDARFRTMFVVVRHAAMLGAALPRKVAASEVATIGMVDAFRISQTLTVTGPGVGSVLAYGVIAVLLFAISPVLAVVVLIGVPVLAVLVGPLLGRLHGAESAYRERQSELTARVADIVGGLRVLNGLGGKDLFADRYRRRSSELRSEGYRVGAVTSWVQALTVGLPLLFLAAVTWLAARMAAVGDITVGELVAVYGYAAVLVVPVTFFIEGGYEVSRGLVAARRVVRFLAVEPELRDGVEAAEGPAAAAVLHDPVSGIEIPPRTLTALVSSRSSDSAAVVDRLARFTGSDATWGGVPLTDVALSRVRDRILVADNEADVFTGPLREVVAGRWDRDDDAITEAIRVAMAEDVVQAMPDGLGSAVDAQGRNLSGGQRQRIRLVRALLAEPEVLMAIEPTSALDAHTEAIVAARLRAARTGRTTVVTSTSPLVLEQADLVYYVVDGVAAASGGHRELLRTHAGYRRLVSRGAG